MPEVIPPTLDDSATEQPPQYTDHPPVGLMSDPIGNVATEQPGAEIFPSRATQGQDWFGTTKQIGRAFGRSQAELGAVDDLGNQVSAPEQTISADDANKAYGVPGRLKFNAPIPASVAQSMQDAKRDELSRADAAARTPDGAWAATKRMGLGFVAGALDPLNVAAALMPTVGEARMAGMLGRVGLDFGEGALGTRIATGALGGVTGTIPLVAAKYGLSQQEQADYSAMDALADVAMGGVIGGVLHPIAGALHDAFGREPTARAPDEPGATPSAAPAAAADAPHDPIVQSILDEINATPEQSENATRTAVAQMVEGRPAEVRPIFDGGDTQRGPAPRSLVDFLIDNGGVKDEGGDLAAMDGQLVHQRANGRLVNNTKGLELDYAREGAEEAGYLPHNSTIADLLSAVQEELAGNKRYTGEDSATAFLRQQAQHQGPLQAQFEQHRDTVQGVADEAGVTLRPAEADHAAELMMNGMYPEEAIREATLSGDMAASQAFDRAARYAHGEPTPEEANISKMADEATKDAKPDDDAALPKELEDSLADVQETLARYDMQGVMTDADRAEVEMSKGWLEQAKAFGKGLLRAGVCIAQGGG